jgi:hypothetical protein
MTAVLELPAPTAPLAGGVDVVAVLASMSCTERGVALFASDMPTGYVTGRAPELLRPWILQGIERLGREAIRIDAEALRQANLQLLRTNFTSRPAKAWIDSRFPGRRRHLGAQSAGAMSMNDVRPSLAVRERHLSDVSRNLLRHS